MKKPRQEIKEKTLDLEMAFPTNRPKLEGKSLQHLLDTDEELIWEGKPDLRVLGKMSINWWVIGLGGLGLSFLLMIGNLPLLFVYFVLCSFLGPFWLVSIISNRSEHKRREKLAYFFTNKKVIFKTSKLLKPYQAIPFDQIKDIRFQKQYTEDHGTIFIKTKSARAPLVTRNLQDDSVRECPTFELIPNILEVQQTLLREWQQQI